MILAVSGSRHSGHAITIARFIARFGLAPSRIVTGEQKGVDAAARAWATDHDIPLTVIEAEWTRYGKAAGPIRSLAVIKRAHALLALPCKHSKGTLRAIDIAKELGVELFSEYIRCNGKNDIVTDQWTWHRPGCQCLYCVDMRRDPPS